MDSILNKIKEIALKYGEIKKVVLFGSRARGDNTEASDYDIAVYTSDIQPSVKAAFLNDIESIETFNKIDVIFIKNRHIDTELYINIQREGIDIMDKFQIKLSNYVKALSRLEESIRDAQEIANKTMRDGVIQRFEFTTELAWKTVREFLICEGITDLNSPKSVMAEAFKNKLIADDTGWLQILQDRNSTSHIYDEEDAEEIYERIQVQHVKLFGELKNVLTQK